MHIVLAAALVLAATVEPPPDAEVAKGLRNLAQIQSISQLIKLRAIAGVSRVTDIPRDPWGTRYQIEGERVISAGSDREFELVELPSQQFSGLAGDLVVDQGRMLRSNRNWLYSLARPDTQAAAALQQLRIVELQSMFIHLPMMQNLMLARMTVQEMLRSGATTDAWGTPLRMEGTKIISAGADREFDQVSWDKPPTTSLNEDMIVENGVVTRVVDSRALVAASEPVGVAVAQPADPPLNTAHVRLSDSAGDLEPPKALTRVEPQYPDDYRRSKIGGLVIVEAAVSATGTVDDVRVLKSAAPDLDMAAIAAVRQWTFQPGRRAGTPIAMLYSLTVNFQIP
jgi:TonB family protein